MRKPVRIGVGGPVGSGKTALLDCLCKSMRDRYELGVVTNDIFTREDMEFLVRSEALPADRILGVQTGGGPLIHHRQGRSRKLEALAQLSRRHSAPRSLFCCTGARTPPSRATPA